MLYRPSTCCRDADDGDGCSGFLLGPRLAEARAAGHTGAEADLYEWNLRTQLSVWGSSPKGGSEVEDYANREWAGLISSYYKPRSAAPLPSDETSMPASPQRTSDCGTVCPGVPGGHSDRCRQDCGQLQSRE